MYVIERMRRDNEAIDELSLSAGFLFESEAPDERMSEHTHVCNRTNEDKDNEAIRQKDELSLSAGFLFESEAPDERMSEHTHVCDRTSEDKGTKQSDKKTN